MPLGPRISRAITSRTTRHHPSRQDTARLGLALTDIRYLRALTLGP